MRRACAVHMQVLDGQRELLRATVQSGQEYVAWLEAQLDAYAVEGAQGAPSTPQRLEQSKSQRSQRHPQSKPTITPAAKPPSPKHAQGHDKKVADRKVAGKKPPTPSLTSLFDMGNSWTSGAKFAAFGVRSHRE